MVATYDPIPYSPEYTPEQVIAKAREDLKSERRPRWREALKREIRLAKETIEENRSLGLYDG